MSLNSSLAQRFGISNVSTYKPIYHYGVNCDRATATTITIDFAGNDHNCMTALIFTRHALVGFNVEVAEAGKVDSCNISNIVGTAAFSETHYGSKVILKINVWETFEMLFIMHGIRMVPTFTVS